MQYKVISPKKEKQLAERDKQAFSVGERAFVKNKLFPYCRPGREEEDVACIIRSIEAGESGAMFAYVQEGDGSIKNSSKAYVPLKDLIKSKYNVGANPFNEKLDSVRAVAYTLESILFNCDILSEKSEFRSRTRNDFKNKKGYLIKELNWNPYVYTKDKQKQYYQRGFVWSLEDKQLLVESIYQGIDCGKIVVRLRSWKDIDKMDETSIDTVAFKDLVDGKQRLDAVRGFICGQYCDLHGNYFGDLSFHAQHKFVNHQLFSYAEMPESTTDEEVIAQFLKLNFAGVPQSKEHIEFVKSIHAKI